MPEQGTIRCSFNGKPDYVQCLVEGDYGGTGPEPL